MKKLWIVVLLALFSAAPRAARAAITDAAVLREKTVVVHYSTTVPAGATSTFDLISIATTTGFFPHLDRGELDPNYINTLADKVSTSSGNIKIGVLSYVGASTGTAVFFFNNSFLKNVSNNANSLMTNSSDTFYRCRVTSARTATNSDVDGITPFILSNDKRQGSTNYHIGGLIASPIPAGFVNPNVGDIVMEVNNSDSVNSINVIVDVWYHSEP